MGPALAAIPPAERGGGRGGLVLSLGVAGLVTGFTVVGLLAAVVAIVMASVHFQRIDAGEIDASRRGAATGGLVCGIVALSLWIPVAVATVITES
ncbi:MAG: hypothetical protein AB7V42_10005 [Thermoleophilia bacterium]